MIDWFIIAIAILIALGLSALFIAADYALAKLEQDAKEREP